MVCRDDQGCTALHWAAAHGLDMVVDLLLEAAEAMQMQQLEPSAAGVPSSDLPSLKLLQVSCIAMVRNHIDVNLHASPTAASKGVDCV